MESKIEPAFRVYMVVNEIPFGKVASYGQIAALAGLPRAARFVGNILKKLPSDSTLPWYRVIGHQGKISLTGERAQVQRQKLFEEGILFSQYGKINLAKYGWQL